MTFTVLLLNIFSFFCNCQKNSSGIKKARCVFEGNANSPVISVYFEVSGMWRPFRSRSTKENQFQKVQKQKSVFLQIMKIRSLWNDSWPVDAFHHDEDLLPGPVGPGLSRADGFFKHLLQTEHVWFKHTDRRNILQWSNCSKLKANRTYSSNFHPFTK